MRILGRALTTPEAEPPDELGAPVPQHSGASTFTTGYLYSRRSRQDPLDGETHLGVPPVLVIVIGSP